METGDYFIISSGRVLPKHVHTEIQIIFILPLPSVYSFYMVKAFLLMFRVICIGRLHYLKISFQDSRGGLFIVRSDR